MTFVRWSRKLAAGLIGQTAPLEDELTRRGFRNPGLEM